MFDALSEKLQSVMSDVRSRGKLSEDDVNKALREIRLALLEADVNFKVVKSFTATLKERCLGAEVLDSLNPGQQVVKIVNEELTAPDGRVVAPDHVLADAADRDPDGRPAGLGQDDRQRASWPRCWPTRTSKSVALAACDVYRPGGRRSARARRRAGRRDRLRAGHRRRSAQDRRVGARPGNAGTRRMS